MSGPPSTDDVREGYARVVQEHSLGRLVPSDVRLKEFDAWLLHHDREVAATTDEQTWYIDFEGELFEGEIGPFNSRERADEFARILAHQGRSASWTVVPLTNPEELL